MSPKYNRKLADIPSLAGITGGGELAVTEDHLVHARANKAVGIVPMWPIEFLTLTTSDPQSLRQFVEGGPPELEDFNYYAVHGDNIIMPMLRVDMKTGEVQGHEGRHRAAALRRANPHARMWVAIILRRNGSVYYEHGPPPHYKKRWLGVKDVPRAFYGEFAPTMIQMDLSEFIPLD